MENTDTDQNPPTQIPSFPWSGLLVGIIISFAAVYILAFVVFPGVNDEMTPVCKNFTSRVHSDVPIYSTEDGTYVHGEFFLGIGRVDTYPAYYFYTGDDTNGFQRQMLKTDVTNVVVFRDAPVPYKIEKTEYRMVSQGMGVEICSPVSVTELHVPANTTIKEM